MNTVTIDVREKDEFEAEHIENAICVPLSTFHHHGPALLNTLRGKSVIMMCRSGKRAQLAATQAAGFCTDIELKVYEGGMLAWKKQGNPTVAAKRGHLPIMRQVQLIAGALILAGSLLSYFVSPGFLLFTGFVGAGLTLAGATGFCGMAELLSRAPWNKVNTDNRKELCEVSPSSKSCCS